MLSSAASLFRRHGYAGATTRDLAASLGIQSASLYHHIGSKEDLLYEICVTALETITAEAEAALLAPGPPDPLRRLIRTHVRVLLGDLDAHTVMLVEMRALSDARREKVLALRDAYQDLVERTITLGQEAELVRADIPARQLTLGLLNLLNWTFIWYRAGGELSPAAIAAFLERIYMEGVGRQEQ